MSSPASRTAPPFPTRFPAGPVLTLTRRSRTAAADAHDVSSQSHRNSDAERALRQLEQSLAERERLVTESQARLAERTRDLDEMEALLRAREALLASTRLRDTGRHGVVTFREAEALQQLKTELDRQEAGLLEARAAIREREKFLDDSETRLFAKVQAQQEKETELEQREENLAARAAQSSQKPYDEFRE